jgi:hypothetical protein
MRWQKPPNQPGGHDLSQDTLSEQDWHDLQLILDLLAPFKHVTKRIEGNANKEGQEGSHGAVWEVLYSMDYLFAHIQEVQARIDANPTALSDYYKTGLRAAYLKLIKYYGLTDQTPIYRAASAVHPSYKYSYFEAKWGEIGGRSEWIREAKAAIKQHYKGYAEQAQDTASESEHRQDDSSEDNLDRWGRLSDTWRARKRRKHEDDLERFAGPVPDRKDEKMKDPLDWWRRHESDYPVLAKMVFDLFSIPGMSSDVERVFSQTNKLITDERNRLGATVVEAIECQKDWVTRGLVQ